MFIFVNVNAKYTLLLCKCINMQVKLMKYNVKKTK